MSIFDLFLIALGLSMDAFAVSVCKGLSVQSMRPRHALVCGVWFGVFQALMPLCGYLLGAGFAGLIGSFSHWVAFILLAFIGWRSPLPSTRWPRASALPPCRCRSCPRWP